MQAFAAGGLQKRPELYFGEPRPHVVRRRHYVAPAGTGARIEIEYQPVRFLQCVDRAATGVDFEHACLYQRNQSVDIVDRDDLGAFFRTLMEMLAAAARSTFGINSTTWPIVNLCAIRRSLGFFDGIRRRSMLLREDSRSCRYDKASLRGVLAVVRAR